MHARQDDAPTLAAYVSNAQAVQALAFIPEYRPEEQREHPVEYGRPENSPFSHGWHVRLSSV
jgi:hypothetical protein